MGNTYLTQYLPWPNSNEGWEGLGTKFENKQPLAMIKNFTARIVTCLQKFDRITPVLKELKWLSVESMLIFWDCILVFKC